MPENFAIRIKILDPRIGTQFPMPGYATPGSAAIDLVACVPEAVCISGCRNGDRNRLMVPTGIAVEIPEGYVGLLFPRSGLATKHGLQLQNCVGVIDSDYRGEIKAALVNTREQGFMLEPGMRVAQLAIMPVVQPILVPVDELGETGRGAGGFGSTGLAG